VIKNAIIEEADISLGWGERGRGEVKNKKLFRGSN